MLFALNRVVSDFLSTSHCSLHLGVGHFARRSEKPKRKLVLGGWFLFEGSNYF